MNGNLCFETRLCARLLSGWRRASRLTPASTGSWFRCPGFAGFAAAARWIAPRCLNARMEELGVLARATCARRILFRRVLRKLSHSYDHIRRTWQRDSAPAIVHEKLTKMREGEKKIQFTRIALNDSFSGILFRGGFSVSHTFGSGNGLQIVESCA